MAPAQAASYGHPLSTGRSASCLNTFRLSMASIGWCLNLHTRGSISPTSQAPLGLWRSSMPPLI
ncbi:hypothetical protein BC830DRAFT_1123252, partial [Chytriomyces sp. MP71]